MPLNDSPSPAPSERLLRQLASGVAPSAGAQARVRQMLRSQMRAPQLLKQARDAVTPDASLVTRLWSRILRSMDPVRHLSLWDRLEQSLQPATDLRDALWQRISGSLVPASAPLTISRPIKWAAAFAVVLVGVRASPLLFLAPATIAESPVTLFATQGNVEVLLGSLWQPISGEVPLRSPTHIATHQSQASLINHDDAVFRLGENTRVSFLDLSDRPEPSRQETTLSLEEGEVWVLGLVPKQVRAITVLTPQGRVFIHEGSVSIRQEGDRVTVRVFDRGALVERHGRQLPLVTGEQVVLTREGQLVATKLNPAEFQSPWVSTNLSRDAAHQREIAQLQQERRAASAGILPGSKLYPVKRFAEHVDVLMSFTNEERARKLITQANTRLNEAAAILQTGGSTTEAQSALQEYKDTLLQVATGSGGGPSVSSLIQHEVVEAGAATVAAALPGDSAYALKQAVDDTIASLPESGIQKPDVEGEALIDQLVAVKRQAEQGDTEVARENLNKIAGSLSSRAATGSSALVAVDVQQEAEAAAEQIAAVVEGPGQGITLILGAPPKEAVTLQHQVRINALLEVRPLTPDQVSDKVQEIRGRIFAFGTKKAQYNALEDQLTLLIRNPSRGSILRELSKVLPGNGLAQRVRREIQAVSKEVEEQVTASGGIAPPLQ